MPALIKTKDVQQFLSIHRIDLEKEPHNGLDPDLEESNREFVLGKLKPYYDISLWTDRDTTPVPVRRVIAMLVASDTHERYYSENIETGEGGMTYGQRIKTEAYTQLDDILEGRLKIL